MSQEITQGVSDEEIGQAIAFFRPGREAGLFPRALPLVFRLALDLQTARTGIDGPGQEGWLVADEELARALASPEELCRAYPRGLPLGSRMAIELKAAKQGRGKERPHA